MIAPMEEGERRLTSEEILIRVMSRLEDYMGSTGANRLDDMTTESATGAALGTKLTASLLFLEIREWQAIRVSTGPT